ncbi:MAG: hypothetical protein AB7G48_12080 [Nitrospiraceae bacterium]
MNKVGEVTLGWVRPRLKKTLAFFLHSGYRKAARLLKIAATETSSHQRVAAL